VAQLKEDEWPDGDEQTTTEREVFDERNRAEDVPPPAPPGPDDDDARLKNVTPDEAVD
jgi:hypothetical protein